jgi:hypothetical protein
MFNGLNPFPENPPPQHDPSRKCWKKAERKFIMQTIIMNPAKPYIVLLIFFSTFLWGCGISPELENYEQCLPLLNSERKDARDTQNYSYDSQRFLECRAPVQYDS